MFACQRILLAVDLTGESAQVGEAAARLAAVFGRPESEIHRMAETEAMDLVVIGSHGRHGLGLLLGSTANGALHGANCDVLAVRVGAASSNRSEG